MASAHGDGTPAPGAPRPGSLTETTPGGPLQEASPPPPGAPRLAAEPLAARLGRGAQPETTERFTVTGLLGSGATSRVYSLYDTELRRTIALKVLSADGDGAGKDTDSFFEEARVTASLQHPHVMPVYDVDLTRDGAPCFSMGRVVGRSMDEAIAASSPAARDGKIATPNAVVTVFIAVGQTMAYAHARGLVHQDLKPANVLLGDFGEVLVLDWGSASSVVGGAAARSLSGTPLYMSPEQARREYADQRSDVYCLGASLFHALVLRPPTWSDDVDAFWDKKRRGVIDPLSVEEARSVPAALLSIAMTAMSPEPALRYAGAAEMTADLERFQAGLAVSVHREPLWALLRRWYRSNRRLSWTMAVSCLVVAILAAAVQRERALQSARWEPVADADFTAPLAEHWRLRTRDWNEVEMHDLAADDHAHVRREADALILSADNNPVDLSRREPLLGDVRVEWDYAAVAAPWNLNCFIAGDSRDTGYAFHVAAFKDPASVTLTRGVGMMVLARARLAAPLAAGRTYRFVMEKEGGAVRLSIDGVRSIDYEEPDPEASTDGAFGFDACANSVNRISRLRLWHRPLAQRITPVAYARSLLQLKHYELAYAQFADLYAAYGKTELAPEALYGMAVCRARQGQMVPASALLERFLADYPRHELVPHCLRERIGIARATGDAASLERAIAGLEPYRELPLVRSLALQLALDEIAGIGVKRETAAGEERFPPDIIERLHAATDRVRRWTRILGVPFDETTLPRRVADMLATLARDDLVLAWFPDQEALCADALLRMGRFDEVLSRYPALTDQRAEALLDLGRGAEVLAGGFSEKLRWRALLAIGDTERSITAFPPNAYHLYYLQRLDEALALAPHDQHLRALVLEQQGRYAEALELAIAGWQRCALLLRLGRYDEAEPLLSLDPSSRYFAAFAMIANGDEARGRELLAQLRKVERPPLGDPGVAFAHFLLPLMLDNRDGVPVDPESALREQLQDHRWIDGQWPWHLAAFVAGRIDEQAFLAQPMRLGGGRRLLLARGLRFELIHDWRQATAQYRAYLAAPYDGLTPTGEDYVRWRLAELEKPGW
jgi:hypothetical protein